MRRAVRILCALPLVLGLTACADPASVPGATPSTSPTWVTYVAEVSGVTPGPGDKTVTVRVKALAGREGCSRNVRISNRTEEGDVIFADVVQDSAESAQVGACPTAEPVDVALTSELPFGSRQLTLNQQAWVLKNGTYSRCAENLGCNPPADHCDPTWVRAAVRGLDVSRHSQGTVEACDGDWLIMTVPDDPAACGAEVRPGCEVNTAVRRYFLRNQPAGWSIVVRTNSGGCHDVLEAAPRFPRKLCAGLEPTTRFVTSAPSRPASAPPGG